MGGEELEQCRGAFTRVQLGDRSHSIIGMENVYQQGLLTKPWCNKAFTKKKLQLSPRTSSRPTRAEMEHTRESPAPASLPEPGLSPRPRWGAHGCGGTGRLQALLEIHPLERCGKLSTGGRHAQNLGKGHRRRRVEKLLPPCARARAHAMRDRMVREDLSDKMTFEQRPERREAMTT